MRAVIFDIDGTLLDSATQDEELYKVAVERVLGPVRFRPSLHDYEHVTDTGILLQTLDDNDIATSNHIVSEVQSAFFDALNAHVARSGAFREIPGAGAFLDRLRASVDYGVAIATGGWRGSARIKLDAAGLDIGDIPLVTSDDAIDRAEIMRIALARLPAGGNGVTYFGDGPWDREACERLGWRFLPVGPALDGLLSFDESTLELLN